MGGISNESWLREMTFQETIAETITLHTTRLGKHKLAFFPNAVATSKIDFSWKWAILEYGIVEL